MMISSRRNKIYRYIKDTTSILSALTDCAGGKSFVLWCTLLEVCLCALVNERKHNFIDTTLPVRLPVRAQMVMAHA